MTAKNFEIGAAIVAWIGFLAPPGFASVQNPEDILTQCYEENETILTSTVSDIEEFDTETYGVTLQKTIPVPEKGAVIYLYSPRDIMCVVVSEEE